MNPQLFGPLMDGLLAAGALDVFYTPVQMKKSRPGTLITIIAPPDRRHALTDLLFRESTTIGVRYEEMSRTCLDRAVETVTTPYGEVRFKIARRDGQELNASPEFDDCARLAAQHGVSVKAVQAAAIGLDSEPRVRDRRIRIDRICPAAFYLTTAIDYVNSRPHLGTGLREDHGRRDRPLQAADGCRHLVRHRQRRALAERLPAREGAGARSAGLLRPDGARVPRRLRSARRLLRRLHPDDPAAAQGGGAGTGPPDRTPTATSTKGSTRAGTASAARRSSRRRTWSTASVRCTAPSTGSRRRTTSSGCRSTTAALQAHIAAHPEFIEPDIRRNEILKLLESGLEDISISRAGQAWGIPVPHDPVQRRLRVVRRADQLRVSRRLRHR